MNQHDPEFANLVTFSNYLLDEERETFTVAELHCLNARTQRPMHEIRRGLEIMGFSLDKRSLPPRKVRGFTTSSSDRWYGPGAEPTHGGSGF